MPKVNVYYGGDPEKDGCTVYRMKLPADVLKAQGFEAETFGQVDGVVWRDIYDMGGEKDSRVYDWPDPDCDIAVFQRPLERDLADIIEIAVKRGVTVIVDMDDDFFSVQKDNVAWQHVQAEFSPKRNTDHLKRAIAAAHGLTVTTESLARRYGRSKARIIPNYVPAAYTDIRPAGHPLRIGWTGWLKTHPGDLESTRGAVGRALESDAAWSFHSLGDTSGVAAALDVAPSTPLSSQDWVPIAEYPQAMSAIDIGIVPLASNSFNQGKSWLKGLEFAALGIPFVASNTQPYVALEREGLGHICRSPKEWEAALRGLMRVPALREDLAERGRALVRERFTVEQHATDWYDYWSDVLVDRRVRAVV